MSETKVALLNKYQVNKSLRSKIKKSIPKPVLCTPFKLIWPNVDSKVQENVLSELSKFFVENDLKAVRMRKRTNETVTGRKKKLTKSEKECRKNEHKLALKESIPYHLRKCLAVGINEVTRALENNIGMMKTSNVASKKDQTKNLSEHVEEGKEECMDVSDVTAPLNTSLVTNIKLNDDGVKSETIKDNNSHGDSVHFTNIYNNDTAKNSNELSVLLVDRSSPWQLHRHLIQMSSICKCPSIAIDNLSERISPLLSLTKLCALGFKRCYKEMEGFEKVYELVSHISQTISALCPSIPVPWMHPEVPLGRGDGASDSGTVVHIDESNKEDDGADEENMDDYEKEDKGISFEDLYIKKGENNHDFEKLFSLRKKSPLLEKKLGVMMFNYNPNIPSFIYPNSNNLSAVFMTKAPDRRLKSAGEGDVEEDVVTMREKLKGFACLERSDMLKSENNVTNRKRRFNDDVVMKVIKNTFKKPKKD